MKRLIARPVLWAYRLLRRPVPYWAFRWFLGIPTMRQVKRAFAEYVDDDAWEDSIS